METVVIKKKREKKIKGRRQGQASSLVNDRIREEGERKPETCSDAFPPSFVFFLLSFYTLDHFMPNHFLLNSLSLFLPPQYSREITLLPDCCIHRTPGFTHKQKSPHCEPESHKRLTRGLGMKSLQAPDRPTGLGRRMPFLCFQNHIKDFCLLACQGLKSILFFPAGRMSTHFLSIQRIITFPIVQNKLQQLQCNI